MSDKPRKLKLGVVGFSDQPDRVGDIVSGGNGPSVIHQRWFVLRDGQFCPADRTSGRDPDPSRQPNIDFITIVLRAGSDIGHHTEQLDACISTSDMEQFANEVAEEGLARTIKELSPPGGRGLRVEAADGSVQYYGTGQAHVRGLDTTDRAITQDQSRWQLIYIAVVIILAALILALTLAIAMAATLERQSG